MMHAMLLGIFRQVEAGNKPVDGGKWDNILGNEFTCVSREVHPSYNGSDYFNSARWFHKHNGGDTNKMSFMQLFWPDPQDGLFPWDDGCADDFIEAQPMLFKSRRDNG